MKASTPPGKVRASGRLRHQFWGDYSATIVLGFDDAASAADALAVLGAPWVASPRDGRALLAVSIGSKALDAEKARLGRYGADVKAIDSVAHSVDYGDPFEVVIPVVPAEQCELFPALGRTG